MLFLSIGYDQSVGHRIMPSDKHELNDVVISALEEDSLRLADGRAISVMQVDEISREAGRPSSGSIACGAGAGALLRACVGWSAPVAVV